MRSRGVLVAAVLAVGVLGGCGAPAVVAAAPAAPAAAPTGGTVDDPVIGVAYPFELLTHCGIRAANFAGHWWRATAPTDQPHPGGRATRPGR
ncbi:hypothetical protein [Pseudonocardia sp. T1-2H]|uniref:hypothetical protein n=1 Tax=Pseudonocardia sp. T1-2H TaxID=3128899 RepID=UPI0031018815